MPLTSYLEVFLAGTLGGIVLELVHWWNLRRRNPHFAKYAKSVFYWAVTTLMVLTGGILTVFYFGNQAEAIIALHVGLSAPIILQKLATTMSTPGARSFEKHGLTDFFGW